MKYINSLSPVKEYLRASRENYFIDKSDLISEVISAVEDGCSYLCVIGPRRFGKTYGANMVASFFGRAGSTQDFFSSQKIGANPRAMSYCGKYNVVFLHGDKVTDGPVSGKEYVELIKSRLLSELKVLYPEASFSLNTTMSRAFLSILDKYDEEELIFVIDEWDFILNQEWTKEEDYKIYLSFLQNMFKDEEIFKLVYFTGVLPIPVFSSTSGLNMFDEYNMNEDPQMCNFFGFTEEDVDELHRRYLSISDDPVISRDDLRNCCEGYRCAEKVRVYNPFSVVHALSTNSLSGH